MTLAGVNLYHGYVDSVFMIPDGLSVHALERLTVQWAMFVNDSS